METQEKKIEIIEKKPQKHYEKHQTSFTTINVDSRIASIRTNCEDPSLQVLLLKYLNSHPNAEFYSLDEISNAIRNEYGYSDNCFKKSGMSKAVSSIQGDLIFSHGTYYFKKVQGVYKLRARYLRKDPHLIKLYMMKNTFMKKEVHCIDTYTIVFTINPDRKDAVKDALHDYLGSEACYGIMTCGTHLVVMLNKNFSKVTILRDALRDFFTNREEYINNLKVKPKRKQPADNKKAIEILKHDIWSGS